MGSAWFLIGLIAVALGCDRGIGPYDPDEQPALPNLDRIYPEGARAAKRPGSAGPANPAAPTQRGEPETTTPSRGNVAGEVIRGRVEIAQALAADAPPNAILFVIARRQGQAGGPPLAVVRAPDPRFPFEFEIGQAQVMIPSMRFEGEISLSARLDGDGNAMTRTPGDLAGQLDGPVAPGASGVVLTLAEKL